MEVTLRLRREPVTTLEHCPRGLVVVLGKLQLKTGDAVLDLNMGEPEFLVLPETPAAPVTILGFAQDIISTKCAVR